MCSRERGNLLKLQPLWTPAFLSSTQNLTCSRTLGITAYDIDLLHGNCQPRSGMSCRIAELLGAAFHVASTVKFVL
jgi:hypothetical protein